MSDYIDLKLLEEDGDEREALMLVISESLNEAVERGVSNIVAVMRYQRKLPQGTFDKPRTVTPLKLAASAADPGRVLDQVLGRLRSAFGSNFHGQILVGFEDPSNPNEPLAGVWERYVSFGSEDDAYAMNNMGSMTPGMGGGPPPQQHGPGMGWSQPMQHGPPSMMSSYQPPGATMSPGQASREYDPGQLGSYNAEDRELVRSVIASGERRLDVLTGELRARDQNLFTMLDYNLKQNHQFMQFLAMISGRYIPPAVSSGPPPQHPIVALVQGLLSAFFPPPAAAPQQGVPQTPPPPQLTMPPPHVPSFHEPMGDPADLNFAPREQEPAYSHGPSGSEPAWRPPANEAEWTAAMRADPEGAKRAAAQLVPPQFRGFLGGK